MEWRENGVLLAVRRHGENAAIIEVFTRAHGRHAGVVRGGAGRRMGPVLQPGAQLDLTWRARLEDHLGAFGVEPVAARAASVLEDRLALAGLSAVCALLSFTLPEREAHAALYDRSVALLDARFVRCVASGDEGLVRFAGVAQLVRSRFYREHVFPRVADLGAAQRDEAGGY